MKNEQLKSLIDAFGLSKAELDDIKKQTDKIGNSIKQEFKDSDIKEFEADNYVAKMAIIENDSINEDMLINIMKASIDDTILSGIIKTREYIDNDALEDAIYNGIVSADIVKACTTHKDPTYRLTIKRRK